MFENIAKVHKKLFDKMVDDLKEDVILRFPPDKTAGANAKDKVFGRAGLEETVDENKNIIVSAAVSGSNNMGNIRFSSQSEAVGVLGMLYESDLVLRLKLEPSILADADKSFGRTIFDLTRDVMVRGQKFKVKGVMRAGFPPLGPYGLYVGLVLAGE